MADENRAASDREQESTDRLQVLDLSTNSRPEEDIPILDLSRDNVRSMTNITEPQMINRFFRPPPAHTGEQYQPTYLSDEEKLRFLMKINTPFIDAKIYDVFCNNNNQVHHVTPYRNKLSLPYTNIGPLPNDGSMKIPTVSLPMPTPLMAVSPMSTSPMSMAPAPAPASTPTPTPAPAPICTETSPFVRNILCNQNVPPSVPTFLKFTSCSETELAPSLNNVKKAPRPFKAYPKDLVTTFTTDYNSNALYRKYREHMLQNYKKENKSAPNPKMRRSACKRPASPTSTVEEKDAVYWERRKKNNEAAKRSRDARRAKEDELAIRVVYLEEQNMFLKTKLSRLLGISIEEVNKMIQDHML